MDGNELEKSYVGTLGGTMNNIADPARLTYAFTPKPDPAQQPGPVAGNSQPAENIDGATGAMVTDTPSASRGIGQMVPGAGTRQ